MGLEERIDHLTSAVTTLTGEIQKILAADEARGGAEADKPKPTRKKAETADAGKTETASTGGAATVPDDLKKGIAAWLGEFAKEEDKANPDGAHPEVLARKAALKKAFEGLGVAKLPEIVTEEGVTKLTTWFGKAKAVDKGFGAGRFVADPKAPADDDDDGLGV